MMTPYNCVICGNPLDLRRPDTVSIPKARAHEYCLRGVDPDDLSEDLPCCSSRLLAIGMGGCILERRSSIPNDEVWVYSPDASEIARYKIFPAGPVVYEPVGTIKVPKSELPKEEEGEFDGAAGA